MIALAYDQLSFLHCPFLYGFFFLPVVEVRNSRQDLVNEFIFLDASPSRGNCIATFEKNRAFPHS